MSQPKHVVYYSDPDDPKVVPVGTEIADKDVVDAATIAYPEDLRMFPMRVLVALYNRTGANPVTKFESIARGAERVYPALPKLAAGKKVVSKKAETVTSGKRNARLVVGPREANFRENTRRTRAYAIASEEGILRNDAMTRAGEDAFVIPWLVRNQYIVEEPIS